VKRRRVLVAAEGRLRAAIQRAAVVARDVERVRDGHLAYLKALRYELQTGTTVDGSSQARLAAADEADRAWRAAAPAEIVAAYSSGPALAPGQVSASFAAYGSQRAADPPSSPGCASWERCGKGLLADEGFDAS